MLKNRIFYLTALFLLAVTANADVPPDAGYLRVSADLIIETRDDLSDFRFFVDFAGSIYEIDVKSNSRSVIPPIGGGVRYSSGRLLAIPLKSLKDYPDKILQSGESGDAFSQSLSQNKINDVIVLGSHQFISTIRKSESRDWSFPTYRLERTDNSLKLIKAADFVPKQSLGSSGETGANGDSAGRGDDWTFNGPVGYSLLVAALLPIILLAIWFIRKIRSTKSL